MASQNIPLPPGPVHREKNIPLPPGPVHLGKDIPPVPPGPVHRGKDLPPVPPDLLNNDENVDLKLLIFHIIAVIILVNGSHTDNNVLKNHAQAMRDKFIRGWIYYHGWMSNSEVKEFINKTLHEFLEKKVFEFEVWDGSKQYILELQNCPIIDWKLTVYSQITIAYSCFLRWANQQNIISDEDIFKLMPKIKLSHLRKPLSEDSLSILEDCWSSKTVCPS